MKKKTQNVVHAKYLLLTLVSFIFGGTCFRGFRENKMNQQNQILPLLWWNILVEQLLKSVLWVKICLLYHTVIFNQFYYCSIVHVVLQEYLLSRNEFVSLIILKIIFQKFSDRTPDKISRTLDMGSINYMYYSLITFMLYLCPHCFHNLKIAFFKNWIIKRICLKGN